MTSPDGISWTLRTSAADACWRAICWSAELGRFVAVASADPAAAGSTGGDSGVRVMTSSDGLHWSAGAGPGGGNLPAQDWTGVCWSPQRHLFVAVAASGSGNRVMTSSDGLRWSSRSSASDSDWRGVCWCPERGLFVAVASTTATATATAAAPSKSAGATAEPAVMLSPLPQQPLP